MGSSSYKLENTTICNIFKNFFHEEYFKDFNIADSKIKIGVWWEVSSLSVKIIIKLEIEEVENETDLN